MKVLYVPEQRELIAFAERAARSFGLNPNYETYTDDGQEGIRPGGLFAVRWGLHRRAVLVLKLDEFVDPVIFGDLMAKGPGWTDPFLLGRGISQAALAWGAKEEEPTGPRRPISAPRRRSRGCRELASDGAERVASRRVRSG